MGTSSASKSSARAGDEEGVRSPFLHSSPAGDAIVSRRWPDRSIRPLIAPQVPKFRPSRGPAIQFRPVVEAMTRRYLNQLGDRETISEVFLAGDKQLRKNRNGNLYLQMRLWDRTGGVNALMWNASDSISRAFDNGDYVRVEGTTQFYNGSLQIIAKEIARVDPGEVNLEDFFQLGKQEIERLRRRLAEILRALESVPLRNLAECFLIDEGLMDQFSRAPAAVKNHHAYHGGLLQHVVNLMEVCLSVAEHYPQLDCDLLVMGAFLHDLGKIDELTYDRDLGYSDEGQLLGHVVIAMSLLDKKLEEAAKLSGEPFPHETALRLKHMVISHHGEYQFGSPRLPMTFEAIALHLLDNLDAKIHQFESVLTDDVNVDSHWTSYHPNLGRKLFKGSDN
jgi:3'-5' exoribonuclease